MMDLSPNIRRLLAIALLLLPLLFFFQYILAPVYAHYSENSAKIQEKRFILARYKNAAKSVPSEKELPGKDHSERQQRNFFHAKNDVIAATNIQAKLKSIASRNRLTVMRASRLAKRKDGPLTLIGVNIELVGVQKDLNRLVYELERSKPYLFIQKLQLAPLHFGHKLRASKDIKLRTRIHVYGAFWIGET